MKTTNLDKALKALKAQIVEDACYAKGNDLDAGRIVDGFDSSDFREMIGELYEAALKDIEVKQVRS